MPLKRYYPARLEIRPRLQHRIASFFKILAKRLVKLVSADETHDHAFRFWAAPIQNSWIRLCSDPCNDKPITYFDSILCFQDDDNISRLF